MVKHIVIYNSSQLDSENIYIYINIYVWNNTDKKAGEKNESMPFPIYIAIVHLQNCNNNWRDYIY
jgi:hypothetical protein